MLYCPENAICLLIIPEEGELVLPKVRAQGSRAKVHLIAYAAPLTRRMLPLAAIDYCALPPLPPDHKAPCWLTIELSIFSGACFIAFDEVAPLLDYIRSLETKIRGKNSDIHATSFLREWLAIRQTGNVLHTPSTFLFQHSVELR